MQILLVEDDAETAGYVMQGLREAGYRVTLARDGRDGLFQASGQPDGQAGEHEWDLLIVDRMLPAVDGLSLVRMLRAGGIETPALFLTTLGGVDDRVNGLNAGADDYLVKPFAFSELLARVAALGRRPRRTVSETTLRLADIEVNLMTRNVTRGGEAIDLQPREYRLLEFLMRHAGQVVTRTMLLEQVWDLHFDPRTNVVDSHISRLRTKIDKGHEQALIQTVRGAGYMLREPA